MQIIVGLKCKEVSEKGCLLSLLCHLFIIYFLFLNQRDSHENRTKRFRSRDFNDTPLG